MSLRRFSVRPATTALAFLCLVCSAFAADPFSIVLLPDTQYYTQEPGYDIFDHQMQWINTNKNTYNIKFVIHLGDMTDDNIDSQWSVARSAYNILDATGIPYSVLPGNHDYKGQGPTLINHHVAFRDLVKFNTNFGPQKFTTDLWYGGNKGETTDHNENNYCFFEVGDLKFMVLSLEFAPRKDTMTWANNLIAQYPDRRVIIATHAYLTNGGSYSNSANANFGIIGAGGSHLWDELVRRHSNVYLAVCGHVGDSELNTKTGVAGNTIYEMLVDYQFEKPRNAASPNLGNGWLRVLQFDPDASTVDAFTITTEAGNSTIFVGGNPVFYNTADYAASYTAEDHLFSFGFDPAPLGDYYYLNASTNIHDFTVNATGGGDQLDADIAQDAMGNFVAVWEDDSDSNGINTIRMRGFDYDGNQRFSEAIVNSVGTNTVNAVNPRVGMAPDGRFAVAFQTSDTDVKVRVYNANGTATAAELSVPTTAGGTKRDPDVDMADNGDFVVVWEDDADGNGSYQVKARGFLFNRTQKFAQKTINTVDTGQQYNPDVAVAPNGDYVVIWMDDQNVDALYEIGARGFYANETQKFAQMFANATTAGQQADGEVAIDDSGRFFVVWEDDADNNGSYQVRARGFSATGTQILSERTVNSVATGNQTNPSISMEPGGNWYVAWQDDGVPEGNQMMVQGFDIAGTALFAADVQANYVANCENDGGAEMRKDPVISVHSSGRSLIGWVDDTDGNGGFQILARGLTGLARSLVIKTKNGSVAKSPDTNLYKTGASVTLTANPDTDYSFERWYGNVPAGQEYTNPLTITMDANKSLTASFVATNPTPTPSPSPSPSPTPSPSPSPTPSPSPSPTPSPTPSLTPSPTPSLTPSPTPSPTPGPEYLDIIVDNDSGAPAYAETGSWLTSGSTGYNGGTYRYANDGVAATATWTAATGSGQYQAFVYYRAGANRCTSTKYVVSTATGNQTVYVNQTLNSLTWVSLGTFRLAEGNNTIVLDAAGSTGGDVVIADAIRFTFVERIVDNDHGSPDYTETGTWVTSGSAGYNGGTYRWANSGQSNTATWDLNLPGSGTWTVSVIYRASSNRCTSTKYVVQTASGPQTVYKNQTTSDLTWVTLGTWTFDSGGGSVTIDAAGSTGGDVVIADAVRAVKQ